MSHARTLARPLIALLVATGAAACEQAPSSDAGRLDAALQAASDEFAVPRPILEAIGYTETRFWMRAGEPSTDRGYGAMHLVDAGPNGPLARAARLTNTPEQQLKTDLDANVRGAAALLRDTADRYFRETPSKDERELSAWWQVVMRYGGSDDPVAADLFATTIYQAIGRGARAVLPDGSVHAFSPVPVDVGGEKLFGTMESPLTPDYASAHWVAASTSNFSTGPRGVSIDRVVIHTMQGSYSGSISWFRNPSSQASAHYMVRSSDGDVTQMVQNQDIGWHAGDWDTNLRSIGIEHEGYVDQPQWLTEAMYVSSANLTRWICDTYGIPKDRTHVIGHNEVPSSNPNCHPQQGGSSCHRDPCVTLDGTQCFWNWQHYMDLVGGTNTVTSTLKGFVFGRQGACPEIPNSASAGFGDCVRLVGARVFVPETGMTKLADGNGYWEFKLPPGKYTPSASFAGYQDGQTWRGAGGVTLGTSETYASFSLLPIGTTGTIKGVVYEINRANPADHSKVLDGALAAVGTNVTSSANGGQYQLTGLAVGRVTVTVTKDGYSQATGAVDVTAGQVATLDIGVTAADAKPPKVVFTHPADGTIVGYTPVTVEGTVDDPTATLKVGGTPVVFTNGRFSASVKLNQGLNSIVAEAADPSGNTGKALLRLTYDPTRTGLTGKVIDAISQAPVKGAVVSAGDAFSKTGDDGIYALDLPAGDASVAVQAVGYLARTLTITVKEGQRTNQDIAIVPTGAGSLIEITSPANGATVPTEVIEVTGVAHIPNLAALKVNEVPAEVAPDGTFKASITLTPGENLVIARGRGQDGLGASTQIIVNYVDNAAVGDGCGCASGWDLPALGALAGLALLRRRARRA